MSSSAPPNRLFPFFALAVLLLLGLLVRLPAFHYGLPAGRTPDAAKTVGVALHMAQDWSEGRMRLDPGHYQYPPLYTSVLSTLYLVPSFQRHSEETGRILSGLSLLLAALPIFFLLRKKIGLNPAWGGALLILFGFFFIKQSLFPRPDALQAFFVSWSLYYFLKEDTLDLKDASLGGLFMGLGAAAKYTAPLFLLPVILIRSFAFRPAGEKTRYLPVFISGLFFSGAGFLLGAPSFLWRAGEYLGRLRLEWAIQAQGGFEEAGRGAFSFFLSRNPGGLRDYSLVEQMGAPFALLGAWAVIWVLVQGIRKKNSFYLSLGAGALFSVSFFELTSNIKALRFILPSIIIAILALAAWASKVSEQAAAIFERKRMPIGKDFILMLIFFLCLGPSISRAIQFNIDLKKPDTRNEAAFFMIQHAPAGSQVLNFIFGPALPSGRYKTAQWSLPEYRVQEKDFSPVSLFRAAEEIGAEYVIWNSFYTNRFFAKTEWALSSPYAAAWRDFQEDLNRFSREEASFKAGNGYSPDIKIYRLTTNQSGREPQGGKSRP